jgi:hypothetical protein
VLLPSRDATDSFMARMGWTMDISFDIDLGELVEGHQVVARGSRCQHGRDQLQIGTTAVTSDSNGE